MVNSCVAANCTNKASLREGISLHTIPYFNDDRPEAKRRRKIWVDFIRAKRVFEPSKNSTLCSAHFKPQDYERRFSNLPSQTKPNYPRLRKDDVGICVYPSIQAVPKKMASESVVQSPRDRRMLIKAMTGDKQENKSSVGLAAMQCHTPRPSTNTRCKKRKLETQEVVLPEENEPEESCQDHVANV